MFLPVEFHQGIFLKRYKRFFADIAVDTKVLTGHCPNTGSMKSCNLPNSPCYYTKNDDPKRKLKLTLEAVFVGTSWVGVHTHRANEIVKKLILPQHKNYKSYPHQFSEVKISDKSRADFVLSKKQDKKPNLDDLKNGGYHIIEVKNVSYAENNIAYFPDAVTTRGQKHINELCEQIKLGNTAELIFLIQRSDFTHFEPAEHIDPEYSQLLKKAQKQGLKINAYIVDVTEKGYQVREEPVKIKI